MFRAPRGTSDLLPGQQKYWRYIESKAMELASEYGFGRIDTPVFENADIFQEQRRKRLNRSTMPRKKKPRGRPVKHKAPKPIPDTVENVTNSLFRTRPKAEREMLTRRADRASKS